MYMLIIIPIYYYDVRHYSSDLVLLSHAGFFPGQYVNVKGMTNSSFIVQGTTGNWIASYNLNSATS